MKARHLTKHNLISVLFAILLLFSGCSASRTMKGGAIGSGVGGAVGAAIGSKSNNTAEGAIIGAMIGGTAGALIGHYMDKQAEELQKDLKDAKVERVGEGIKITFDSGILFDFDSYNLRNASEDNLTELAATLKKYQDTNILIEGHTDSVGTAEYNQTLSMERATSVADYLDKQGVNKNRFTVKGYGESQPVAPNDTEAGRQKNRRVEIAIYADKKLKRAAKRGDIG